MYHGFVAKTWAGGATNAPTRGDDGVSIGASGLYHLSLTRRSLTGGFFVYLVRSNSPNGQ